MTQANVWRLDTELSDEDSKRFHAALRDGRGKVRFRGVKPMGVPTSDGPPSTAYTLSPRDVVSICGGRLAEPSDEWYRLRLAAMERECDRLTRELRAADDELIRLRLQLTEAENAHALHDPAFEARLRGTP
jgi:hypothetical protein